MVAAALALWVGVPLGCLWLGSQVQTSTDSVGVAVAAMAVCLALGVWLFMRLLLWLNLQHAHARERRGLDAFGNATIEGVMAVSAGLALVSFCIWFFLFSGSSPVPINLGY